MSVEIAVRQGGPPGKPACHKQGAGGGVVPAVPALLIEALQPPRAFLFPNMDVIAPREAGRSRHHVEAAIEMQISFRSAIRGLVRNYQRWGRLSYPSGKTSPLLSAFLVCLSDFLNGRRDV